MLRYVNTIFPEEDSLEQSRKAHEYSNKAEEWYKKELKRIFNDERARKRKRFEFIYKIIFGFWLKNEVGFFI